MSQYSRLRFVMLLGCCCGLGVTIPVTVTAAVQSSSAASNPDATLSPVAQTLIPEGVYAIQLVTALDLGKLQSDAEAESKLSGLGIEPKNGWISEYPMTPVVLGELDNDIHQARSAGKIALTNQQVSKRLAALKTRLGFDISANPETTPPVSQNHAATLSTIYGYTDSDGNKHYTDNYAAIPAEYQSQAKIISQAMVSNSPPISPKPPANSAIPVVDPNLLTGYYQNQGPPVVTYYQPPPAYNYLYSWVSYPFWSAGSYFPGYFMLNNFRQQVVLSNQPYYVSHHAGPARMFDRDGDGIANNWYRSERAQAGANAIVALQPNHLNGMAQQPFQTGGRLMTPSAQFGHFANGVPATIPRFQPHEQHYQSGFINQAPVIQHNFPQQAPAFQSYQPQQFNNMPHAFAGEFHNGFAGGQPNFGHFGGGHMGGGHMGGRH